MQNLVISRCFAEDGFPGCQKVLLARFPVSVMSVLETHASPLMQAAEAAEAKQNVFVRCAREKTSGTQGRGRQKMYKNFVTHVHSY